MKPETNLSESAELIEPAVKESLTAETKEHEINRVFEKALHQTAERVEPTTENIQEHWKMLQDRIRQGLINRPYIEPEYEHTLLGILIERLEAAEATNEALTRELGKTITAADKLEQGIQKFLDGDEPKQLSGKFAGCIHRDLNHQDCARCINDYFSGLLNGARDDNS